MRIATPFAIALLLVGGCRTGSLTPPAVHASQDDRGEDALVEALYSPRQEERDRAAMELARRSPTSLSRLFAELSNVAHASDAARALSLVSDAEGLVVPRLIDLLQTTNDDLRQRRNAATVIYHLRARGSAAIPALVALVESGGNDPRGALRARQGDWSAQAALAAVGRDAVGPVAKLLTHSDPNVRGDAIRILGEIGTDALSADSEIAVALDHSGEVFQYLAMRALLRIGKLTPGIRSAVEKVRGRHDDPWFIEIVDQVLALPTA